MSKRMLLPMSFLATGLLFLGAQPATANSIYHIVPRTLQPNNVSVTGTIETDGTTGPLVSGNVVSFDIQSGGFTFKFSTIGGFAGVHATPPSTCVRIARIAYIRAVRLRM